MNTLIPRVGQIVRIAVIPIEAAPDSLADWRDDEDIARKGVGPFARRSTSIEDDSGRVNGHAVARQGGVVKRREAP